MVTVYREYTRDRIGMVFGLRAGQLIVLGAGTLPVFLCLQRGLWTAALAAFGVWLLVALVLAIADLVAWKLTGRVGWVLVPTGVVAALAAVPSRTRELGVSLLAAVLLSAFVVTVVLLGVIRMPA